MCTNVLSAQQILSDKKKIVWITQVLLKKVIINHPRCLHITEKTINRENNALPVERHIT